MTIYVSNDPSKIPNTVSLDEALEMVKGVEGLVKIIGLPTPTTYRISK